MELYAGLDLHSRNTYIGIMDKEFNRVFKKRVPNHLEHILQTLDPFRDQIKRFVVESTYNWFWLVDGLMDNGYSCAHLANPAAIKQYEGLKHSDDQHDAFNYEMGRFLTENKPVLSCQNVKFRCYQDVEIRVSYL